ncbi:MAG TPA: NYN domain-containing protein [Candidatus Acetothermia bacterium]|nr:NYN domain-containing protein [Candidatus Acetothermia bacterium]
MLKLGVFVDVQNLQETFERQGFEVRYDALKNNILRLFNLEEKDAKFIAFVPYRRDEDRRIRLIDALAFMGFRVVSKTIREHPDGGLKASMDVELVLEAVNLYPELQEVVLVSGDSDFVALVDFLSKRGRRVTIVGPGRVSTSVELIRMADNYYNLEDFQGVLIPRTPREPELLEPQEGPPPEFLRERTETDLDEV